MMRYYAKYIDGVLHSVGVGLDGQEITKSEYEQLCETINEKNILEDQLYKKKITIDSVPYEWREEIQARVNERIAIEGMWDNEEITAEEALAIITGGETDDAQ